MDRYLVMHHPRRALWALWRVTYHQEPGTTIWRPDPASSELLGTYASREAAWKARSAYPATPLDSVRVVGHGDETGH
jgi:hypothetical protein